VDGAIKQLAYWMFTEPEVALQSDTDTKLDSPVTRAELDWLGGFIDSLGPPPWVVRPSPAGMPRHFEGDFLVHKLATDQGWPLFRLMLVGIEAENTRSPKPPDAASRRYYDVVDALACRRKGRNKPVPMAVPDHRSPAT
jgi:hypothetical protein